MLSIRQVGRLLAIQRVFIRHGFDEIIFTMHLFRPVSYLLYLLPWNWFRGDHGPRAVRLRSAFDDLGPIFVKFGQILSTRQDLLPADISAELEKLQDSVPPFPGSVARQIIEEAYEKRLEEIFLEFDEVPVASALVAQVRG